MSKKSKTTTICPNNGKNPPIQFYPIERKPDPKPQPQKELDATIENGKGVTNYD